MNRLIITLLAFLFFNNCSFNENSKIWKNDENKLEKNKNITKVFSNGTNVVSEFNQNLKLNLSDIIPKNKIIINHNNYGSQIYNDELRKIAKYKFSKHEDTNQLNFKPIFLKNGLVFFDKKGTIIKYDAKSGVIWKKNYYSKSEKKLRPKLNFLLYNNNIIVADTIAKYYSVNLKTGKLNWIKNNIYPFNSKIKQYKDKIFIVDYKNTLRCFKINSGNECWNLRTDNSFTISNNKYSLIIVNENVIFSNSIGDITAVDIESGLINWQLPTQDNSIINETYNFKISEIISDGNSLFFSNNKNEFYSINLENGTINWINKINSNIRSVIVQNLIFTISNEGYLYVIDKDKGNIIRITDLFKNYKDKKRQKIYPVGFVIGNKNLYLTISDGKMIITNLDLGNTIKIEKVSGGMISEPFIFNKNLFIIKNGSIVQYN